MTAPEALTLGNALMIAAKGSSERLHAEVSEALRVVA